MPKPIRSKIEPVKVSASEWQNPGQALRGLLEGKGLHTNITLIRYVTDVVGEGPVYLCMCGFVCV